MTPPPLGPEREPGAEPDPIEPIQVDLARVTGIGTLLWVAALVVCLVLAALGRLSWTPVAVCAVGAALGLVGIRWSRGHDTMGRRLRH